VVVVNTLGATSSIHTIPAQTLSAFQTSEKVFLIIGEGEEKKTGRLLKIYNIIS